MRTVLIFSVACAVAGCSIGPDYETPTMNLPDRYSLVAPVTKASPSELYWWKAFNDPVLNQLVAKGLSENLTVAEARERIREAEAVFRRDSVTPLGDLTLQARDNSDSADIGSAELDANFGVPARKQWASRAAQQRLQAAELGEAEAKRLLLSDLSESYINLRFLQSSLALRQQDLNSRQRTLRDIRTQLDAGAATRLDVLRAQALVAETRAEVPQIRSDIVAQRNRISTLLGVPVGHLGIDLGGNVAQPVPVGVGSLGVPADLLRARPDIRVAERQYAAAVSDMGVAEAARYPSLSLSGLLTAPLNGNGANAESLIAGVTVPVFSQPSLAAAEDAAAARAQQALIRWRLSVLGAVEEVENALAALAAANEASAASRELVSYNERALNLSRRLVGEGGNATVLDIIDRERSLSTARQGLARNLRDLAAAYVALRVALGVGHDTPTAEHAERVEPEPQPMQDEG